VAGITVTLPVRPTTPTPGLMLTEVAPYTSQLSAAEPPGETMGGLAVKELIIGPPEVSGGVVPPEDPLTKTDVVAVELVTPLPAVSVYTVLAAGDTALVPLTATLPMPWSMVTVVAPVTLQLSVATSPGLMLVGLALNEVTVGAAPPVNELPAGR